MPEISPYAKALAGGSPMNIEEPIRSMIMQALQPDNLSKMTIKEDGGIDFKMTPQSLEKAAVGMEPTKGPSAQEMRGLAPEQMMSLMQVAEAGERGRRETMEQFMGIPAQRAQMEATKAQMIRNLVEALPEQFETYQDELGRVFLRSRTTGATKQVSGVPPLSFEERMEIKRTPSAIARGTYWKNPKKPELGPEFVPTGEKPPEGFTEKVPTVEREIRETQWQKELPWKSLDLLRTYVTDQKKDGKIVLKEEPDLEGIEALNETLSKEGKEIVAVPVGSIPRRFWKDIPGRDVYVIVPAGKNPTKEDVVNALVGTYMYSREDAEAAFAERSKEGK